MYGSASGSIFFEIKVSCIGSPKEDPLETDINKIFLSIILESPM